MTLPREGLGKQAALLLSAATLCAALSNAVAGPARRLEWIRPALAAPATARTEAARPWTEISGEEARDLFLRKDVPFLDARRTAAYLEGHVARARSFPVWEAGLTEKIRALYAEGVDPAAPLVVYCGGGECEDSHQLAETLYRSGFDRVLVSRDGFPDWKKRGLPVKAGAEP